MNDNDLERELRSQRGPREGGYTPAALPMTLDEAPMRPSGLSALPRAAIFAGVALAGALTVAVVAGIFAGPGSVGNGSESPSVAASIPASAPALATCGAADVAFSAEPWGGAAGSRGTVVTISLADGRYPCALSGHVAAFISDGNGIGQVDGETAASASVVLEPNAAFTVGIAWSNWCLDAPAPPVSLSMKVEGWPTAVEVDVPAPGGPDISPPCSGAAQPSSLSVTNLQPQQY